MIFIHNRMYLTASEWPQSCPTTDGHTAGSRVGYLLFQCLDSKEEAQSYIIRNEVRIFCWALTYT